MRCYGEVEGEGLLVCRGRREGEGECALAFGVVVFVVGVEVVAQSAGEQDWVLGEEGDA